MTKYFQKIFLISALALVFAATIQAHDCGLNEEFKSCGSACPPRCGESAFKPCTMQCVIGCQCKDGYMLNAKDECVLPEDC